MDMDEVLYLVQDDMNESGFEKLPELTAEEKERIKQDLREHNFWKE